MSRFSNSNFNEIGNLSKKTIRIDVTNPPLDTGLLPLTGTNTAQDTANLQAIFNWIGTNQNSFNAGSLYTGYTYEVYFPMMSFTFSSKIIMKGTYLKLIGNRTIINSTFNDYVFEGIGSTGWNFFMDGFTFPNNYRVLNLSTDNLEAGFCLITRNWFIDVVDIVLNLNKQSSQAFVEYNKFHKCGYPLVSTNIDECHFDKNWVSEKPRTISQDASIIANNRIHARNNLFVPYPVDSTAAPTETAYFKLYADAIIEDNHFGGEPGSKAVANVFTAPDIAYPYNPSSVVVKNNNPMYCQDSSFVAVRLFNMPNKLDVVNNAGFSDIMKAVAWSTTVTGSTIVSSLNRSICQVNCYGNIGQSANKNQVPTELQPFAVNPITNSHFHNTKLTSPQSGAIPVSKNIALQFGNNNLQTIDGIMHSNFLVKLDINPSNGSGYYHSVYVGILSFKGYYTGSAVNLQAILTPLVDIQGGVGSGTNSVTVTFDKTGTNAISSTGDFVSTNPANLTISIGAPCVAGTYQIRDMEESMPLF